MIKCLPLGTVAVVSANTKVHLFTRQINSALIEAASADSETHNLIISHAMLLEFKHVLCFKLDLNCDDSLLIHTQHYVLSYKIEIPFR